jgi:hypothetical protein
MLFKPLSPEDLHIETIGGLTQHVCRHGGIREFLSAVSPSFYLNANHWQDDIARIADQMDHFVVYVSSITDSLLWELDLLKRTNRANRTTVVFDEEAIVNKREQVRVQARIKTMREGTVLWPGNTDRADTVGVTELRGLLADSFPVVVSTGEFFATIDAHKRRIAQATGPTARTRHAMVGFRFHPALDPDALAELRDLDHKLDILIRRIVTSRLITNLPWFFNRVQLRILTALMLADHNGAGWTLGVYAAVVKTVAGQLLYGMPSVGLTHAQRAQLFDVLGKHFAGACEGSSALLLSGPADEFGDYSDRFAIQDDAFTAAEGAVGSFFEAAHRAHSAIRVLPISELAYSSEHAQRAAEAIVKVVADIDTSPQSPPPDHLHHDTP